MTRIRMIGLCLVAAFALSALVAATASASGPNWYECAKVTGGKYEKGCGKKGGKGGYALQVGLGKGKAYKGKGGEAVLHTVIPGKGDIKVACAGAKDVVTPVLGGVAKVKVTFSKCKSGGSPCSSAAKKETIETASLAGPLGYISKSPVVIGTELANEANPATGVTTEFECTGLAKVRVKGASIGIQTGDIGNFSKEYTSTFEVGPYLGELKAGYTPLTNTPEFEGGSPSVLLTELNAEETGNTWQPEGSLPAGQQMVAVHKGESLMVQ